MTRLRLTVLPCVLCVLLAGALALSACGTREERGTSAGGAPPASAKVTLLLDYLPNVDHAGIYTGIADGEFRRAGLDVTPQTPADAATPLKLLVAGKADMAISYEPELLLARDKGAQLVSVAAIVQRPLTSFMSVNPKVTSPSALKGQTVGTAGIPYQSAYLQTILDRAKVPASTVKEVNVGFNLVPAMIGKKVDATLGAFWNVEGVQLRLAHKRPSIVPVDRAGVPTYDELVLVVRKAYAQENGATIRRFVQALRRSTDAVKANPAVGVAALRKADPSLNEKTTTAQLQASLHATPPVFFPANPKQPFGWQSGAQWQRFSTWMFDHNLLDHPASPGALSNEFLPGEGI